MFINDIETDATHFAYDGCHKIYLIEDNEDMQDANDMGYDVYSITHLAKTYVNSCPLRFINNWKLTKTFVGQGENATFRGC